MSSFSPLRGRAAHIAIAIFLVIVFAFLVSSFRPQISTNFGKLPLHSSGADLLGHTANETLGFEKIFAISLPTRTDQRDAIALTAAYTGLRIDMVDGVTDVSDKALPGDAKTGMSKGEKGCWRAHMNVLQMIVDQDISSALLIEADGDWDLHVKKQMRQFAVASQMLLQPVNRGENEVYLDPTYPKPEKGQHHENIVLAEGLVAPPISSPYGDDWDLLWLGHCGARFPEQDDTLPLARIIIADDETVPAKRHLDFEWGTDEHIVEYPEHTRVVSRAHRGTCTLSYAVSQQGARKLLYALGIRSFNAAIDLMMRDQCHGDGVAPLKCLAVQPPIFAHHRPAGSTAAHSDIHDYEPGIFVNGSTTNIRWSTRLNLPQLSRGKGDYVEQWNN